MSAHNCFLIFSIPWDFLKSVKSETLESFLSFLTPPEFSPGLSLPGTKLANSILWSSLPFLHSPTVNKLLTEPALAGCPCQSTAGSVQGWQQCHSPRLTSNHTGNSTLNTPRALSPLRDLHNLVQALLSVFMLRMSLCLSDQPHQPPSTNICSFPACCHAHDEL